MTGRAPTPPRARAIALTALGLVITVAQPVRAEMSVWARAKDPQAAREQDTAKVAADAISRDYALSRLPSAFYRAQRLRRALQALTRIHAESSPNVELRHRLAEVHYRLFDIEEDLGHIEAATRHFEHVVASGELPVLELSRALMSLAICYARLGRHEEETAAYAHAIRVQADPVSHSVLLANQAEGLMARGRVSAAVHGYEASLASTPSPLMIDSGVTTMWGLAVALDRAGDLERALENIRRARTYDPGDMRINGSGWFYVPAYDRFWYEALGNWQIARDNPDALVKRGAYQAAIQSWRAFIEQANPNDPWLAIGEFRRDRCELEMRAAMAKAALDAAKHPPGPPTPEDPMLWPTP